MIQYEIIYFNVFLQMETKAKMFEFNEGWS
jgi:hypothetical protein